MSTILLLFTPEEVVDPGPPPAGLEALMDRNLTVEIEDNFTTSVDIA